MSIFAGNPFEVNGPRIFLLCFLFTALAGQTKAQSPADSAYVGDQKPAGPRHKPHSPKTATLLSMALPGLGQIYNRKNWWWKVPLIYGAGGALAYSITFYNTGYNQFRAHYQYCVDNNLTSLDVPGYGAYYTPTIKAIRDSYKETRDLCIIYAALLYAVQVVDATVEAHFLDFNVSDNLSLKLEPAMLPLAMNAPGYGLKLTLNLK